VTLGEKIKALREARGWQQQELARRARVRQALLSELESGKKTDTTGSVLGRLAWALGVSVDYLIGLYNHHPKRSPGAEGRICSPAPLPLAPSPCARRYGAGYSSTVHAWRHAP
jgi:transcriptional regulator with XRE-family HTH domain